MHALEITGREIQKMADSVSEIGIPIWVKGTQKWVTGLTKRTTCDDVIYALLNHDEFHEHVNTSAYAIFEQWREVERPLQGRIKIVKVWRAWGADKPNVQLSLRTIDKREYSGEFSLTRRRQKSRHKTRDHYREQEACDPHHPDGSCHHVSERLRSMETIVKLVIYQERKLKDLIEHGDDIDKLIEKYESKRSQQSYAGHVQDVSLDGICFSAMDDIFTNANVEELEMYVDYCDEVIALEERIKVEHLKIEDLAYQIQKCANESDAIDGKHFEGTDIANVQVHLNRAVSCAIMQRYKLHDVQRELQFYDEQFKQRENVCKRLQHEVNELESEQNIHSFNESLPSDNNIHSNRFNGSLFKNWLPFQERSQNVHSSQKPLRPFLADRNRPKRAMSPRLYEQKNIYSHQSNEEHSSEPKPILKTRFFEYKNGFNVNNNRLCLNSEIKVRLKTDSLTDKYQWDDSSVSEGISIDHSDSSDGKDIFECDRKHDEYASIRPGMADRPYFTVKDEDNDSNSDTGLSSMHSDDSTIYHLETLV